MKEAFGLEKKGKGTVWMEIQSSCWHKNVNSEPPSSIAFTSYEKN
jgi:hypothetical protein